MCDTHESLFLLEFLRELVSVLSDDKGNLSHGIQHQLVSYILSKGTKDIALFKDIQRVPTWISDQLKISNIETFLQGIKLNPAVTN